MGGLRPEAPVPFRHLNRETPMSRKISFRDSELHTLGLHRFKAAGFSTSGQDASPDIVELTYEAGRTYRIPLPYLLAFYPHGPHEIDPNPAGGGPGRIVAALVEENTRRAVTVVLGDGSTYHVAYDTVLMMGEPEYEHFGGLTAESAATVARLFPQMGPFLLQESG